MKLSVMKRGEVEMEAAAIRCVLNIEYGDEDMPTDFPHRKHETWDVTIDIETGQIRDWPNGHEPYDLYMKVTDGGSYYLLDKDGRQLAVLENEYVPDCIPGEYGDYIDFKIDGSGRITNWSLDADDVVESFGLED